MTWLIIGGVLALLFLAVSLVLALARPRSKRPANLVSSYWPRERRIDVIELSWDEPADRERLGRLGQ